MNWHEQATQIIKQFDERQDVALTTRIMAHGNEALGLLREMVKNAPTPEVYSDGQQRPFETWARKNEKYIGKADFWPWLEQAFNDGRKVPLVGVLDFYGVIDSTREVFASVKDSKEILDYMKALVDVETDKNLHQEIWLATALHYPECWDTAAYPTLNSALDEVVEAFHCQEAHAEDIVHRTRDLIEDAYKADMIVRIDLVSPRPFEMGKLHMVPSFRAQRHSDRMLYDADGKADYTHVYNQATVDAIKRGLDHGKG